MEGVVEEVRVVIREATEGVVEEVRVVVREATEGDSGQEKCMPSPCHRC